MKVVCTHCGLPFSVARAEPAKPVFCCSGCAFAFRLARPAPEAGGAPAPLVLAALGLAFLLLNQALAALLARLSAATNVFAVASLVAGVLAWGALVFVRKQSGASRLSDRIAAVAALAVLGASALKLRPELALLANLLFLAWSVRGLARRKVPSKK